MSQVDKRDQIQETVIRGFDSQCGSYCAAKFYVRDGVLVKVTPDQDSPNFVGICPKGVSGPQLLYNTQRVLFPLRRTRPKSDPNPGWERVSWDSALDEIVFRLQTVKSRYGPEGVAFYRGAAGGTSIGANQAWVWRLANAFGTPNFITTHHICSWHRETGSTYTYGVGLPFPDFENTKCMLIWGHNPYASWRGNVNAITKAQTRGAKLIVVDPRRTLLARRADLWLPIRPGTDGALALGLVHILIEEGLYDKEFLISWTNAPFLVRTDTQCLVREADLRLDGRDAVHLVWDKASGQPRPNVEPNSSPALEGTYEVPLARGSHIEVKTAFQLLRELAVGFPPQRVADITGVSPEAIQQAAYLLTKSGPSCYFTYNGIEQQTNAMQTNRALCILYSLTGYFDAKGGNVLFPKARLNNVDGFEFLNPEVAKRRLGWKERPLGTGVDGKIRAPDAFDAMLTGKPYPVRGLLSFGGNLVTCTGDSIRARKALESLDVFALAEFFMTPAAQMADFILPAATPWESPRLQPGFRGKLTTLIQYCPPIVEPRGESRPDIEIIFELAKRLGLGQHFWEGNVEAGWDYQLALSGLTKEDLKKRPSGMLLPANVNYQKYRQRGFPTPSGRIEIFSQRFQDHGYDPLPVFKESLANIRSQLGQTRYPLLLINSKVVYFCHGQHRAVPDLRKHIPHPYLEINPADAASRSIQDGDWVELETCNGRIKVQARVTDDIIPGVVNTQHGWWQACPELGLPGYDPYSPDGANANLLVTNELSDPISGSIPYKGYPCEVRNAVLTGSINVPGAAVSLES